VPGRLSKILNEIGQFLITILMDILEPLPGMKIQLIMTWSPSLTRFIRIPLWFWKKDKPLIPLQNLS